MSEIIFEVTQDEIDGGYVAVALGPSIATEGETLNELRLMVRDAMQRPKRGQASHFPLIASPEIRQHGPSTLADDF